MNENQTELLPAEKITTVARRDDAQQCNALSMLSEVTKRGGDIGTIEALAKLYREERDDGRRMAFDSAMAMAQSEMRRVAPDGNNPQTHSKYATYAALDRALRPIYTDHGFGLSFNTTPGTVAEMVRVTCHVSHREGWGQDYQIDMPADGKGAKGGDVMTKTHAAGSAVSYGMRYLLKMIFNVAIGQDDDGNAAGRTVGAPIDGKQRNLLADLLAESGRSEAFLCGLAEVRTLGEIPGADFKVLSNTLQKIIDGNKAKAKTQGAQA